MRARGRIDKPHNKRMPPACSGVTVAARGTGFTRHEFYGNVAGAPFAESASEFAIVGRRE